MMGDFALLTAGAASGVEPRQASYDSLTPEMLAKINWDDKSVRTHLILAVTIACVALIVIFVTTRLLVRRLVIGHFFLDDILVSIASVFTIGLCVASLLSLNVGFGQHVWNINLATVLDDIKKFVKLMFIANIFYVCAITFTKLSIIASYIRIFPYTTLRITMYVTAAVTVGLFIASVPATVFQCSPVSAAWDFTVNNQGSQCYTFVNFLYASTAINVTTDLVLCTAPLPYFWKLQMPRKQKIIVSCLFFIGGFACVASIIRLTVLYLLHNPFDITWDLAPSVLWTIAECTIGICCVSVPSMRPLLSKLLPNVFLTRRTPYNRTATVARRQTYAMAGWSGPRTPVDEENKTSESDFSPSVAGEEHFPKSWLGEEDPRGSTQGRSATLKVKEMEDSVSEPKRSLQKG